MAAFAVEAPYLVVEVVELEGVVLGQGFLVLFVETVVTQG